MNKDNQRNTPPSPSYAPSAGSIDTATGEAAPAELSSHRVKEIFSSIAPRYERFNALSSFGTYRSWLRTMMRSCPIGDDARVLDIAGGTGEVSRWVAKTYDPAIIYCTDLVPEMLEVARAHHERGDFGKTPVVFEVVDAQDIPYEDDSFDIVTMAYGIRNMPKREQALSEMLRVLKPGGKLVCLEFSTPQNPLWRGLYHLYLRYLIPFWGGLICKDRKGFVYLSDSIKAFPDQTAFAKLLEDVGFTDIEWRDCTGGIAAIHVASKPTLNQGAQEPCEPRQNP